MKSASTVAGMRLVFALMAALSIASFGGLHLAGAEPNNGTQEQSFKSKCDDKGGTVSTSVDSAGATWSFCKGTSDGNDFKCDTTSSVGGKKCQYTRIVGGGGSIRGGQIITSVGTLQISPVETPAPTHPTITGVFKVNDGSFLAPLP
jgi:hypothetical protein